MIKKEKQRASENLHMELNEVCSALNSEEHSKDLIKIKIENENIEFMNRMLNHDFYDSQIFSGKINFLPPEIQQIIQNTFQRIKDHNHYLRKIHDIGNRTDELNLEIMYNCYRKLIDLENTLLGDIPKISKKLVEEFKLN